MANNVGRIGVALALDSAEFVKGIEKAKAALTSISDFAEKYGRIALTAMSAAGLAALSYADELNDVAKANEVAIDTVIKLQQALVTNGGEAEAAGKLLSGFTKYVDEAAKGSFEAQQRFAKVGISLKDLSTLSMEDLFGKARHRIAELGDSITRNATAYAMFGKTIKGVDLVGLNQDFDAVNATADEQTKRIVAAAEAWDLLKKQSLETSQTIASAVGPTILAVLEYIKTMKGETSLLGEVFRITFETISIVGANVAFVIEGIAKDIYQLYENTKLFLSLDFAGITSNNKKNLDEFDERLRKLNEFEQKVLGGGKTKPASTGTTSSSVIGGTGRTVTPGENPIAKKLEQLKAETAMLKDLERIDQSRAKISLEMVYNKELEVKRELLLLDYAAETAKITEERMKALADNHTKNKDIEAAIIARANLKEKIAGEKYSNQLAVLNSEIQLKAYDDQEQAAEALGKAQAKLVYEMEKQIQEQELQMQLSNERLAYENSLYMLTQDQRSILMQQFDLEAKITEFKRQQMLAHEDPRDTEVRAQRMRELGQIQIDLNQQTIDQQKTFEYGWTQAYQSYIDNATNAANIGRDVFNSVTQNMTNALDNFVKTQKLNFKSFAQSVIQDLISIQLKAQATKLFSGDSGGGGGIMDMIKGLFGGGGYAANTTAMAIPSGFAFADGGSPPMGQASLVGERGPELFVPRTAGTIIPNNQLLSAMGGGQTVNYNGPYIASMNAIDTQSGTQFLAKNKNTIWAAYQSANRGVPVSR
jgi:lambda family phage tail tape measure protein